MAGFFVFVAVASVSRTTLAQVCGAMLDLGTSAGLPESTASGVSADGSVVVGSSSDHPVYRAFRWTASGGMQDIGTLGGTSARARGVSADGTVVVGWAYTASLYQRAFRWTVAGGMQDLGTLGGGSSFAGGVSGDGSVVVGSASNSVGLSRAFRWTAVGGLQDLGTLGGGSAGASSVSTDGMVVVGGASDSTGNGHAFRWDSVGGMQDLGTLGGLSSYANEVSDDGAVVVGFSSTSTGADRAFRWTADGGMENLGTLGGDWSYATAASADGAVVVGYSSTATGGSSPCAFRWTASEGMRDLGTLGQPGGTYAWGVSSGGTFIVGGSSTQVGSFQRLHAYRWVADSDCDGLRDDWERDGVDINADGVIDLDLPGMGAQLDRKDIFVEIDAMEGRAPTASDLQSVVDAFDQAPIPAPVTGGQGGVALHAMIDETAIERVPFTNGWADFDVVKAAHFGTSTERGDANWAVIKAARDRTFHYCIFADSYTYYDDQGIAHSNSSGLAEVPGNDLMVTLGTWTPAGGTPDEKAGTFMHELGHNLGLDHGGGDAQNYKPNYYSVMNYRWQMPQSPYADLWPHDYSREALPPLLESALDEAAGLGATIPEYANVSAPFTTSANTLQWARLSVGHPADWNGDGISPPGQPPVAADINRAEAEDPPSELSLLQGHDDWSNLRYLLSGNVNFGNGHEQTTIEDEFDLDEFGANELIPPPPSPCAADLNGDDALDFFDVQAFLNYYSADDSRADFTADGVLDFFDVQAFLNAYSAGCA